MAPAVAVPVLVCASWAEPSRETQGWHTQEDKLKAAPKVFLGDLVSVESREKLPEAHEGFLLQHALPEPSLLTELHAQKNCSSTHSTSIPAHLTACLLASQ